MATQRRHEHEPQPRWWSRAMPAAFLAGRADCRASCLHVRVSSSPALGACASYPSCFTATLTVFLPGSSPPCGRALWQTSRRWPTTTPTCSGHRHQLAAITLARCSSVSGCTGHGFRRSTGGLRAGPGHGVGVALRRAAPPPACMPLPRCDKALLCPFPAAPPPVRPASQS